MLNILHEKINAISPISCIYDSGDGNFRIDYDGEPSAYEISLIENILDQWPLDKAKLEKIAHLDNQWQNSLNSGYVTSYGWKLGLQNQDVTLLTGAFILLKEAVSIGLASSTSIVDTDGVPHELTIQQMTELMLQYGQYRTVLSQQYAQKKQLINSAQSIEELDPISLDN